MNENKFFGWVLVFLSLGVLFVATYKQETRIARLESLLPALVCTNPEGNALLRCAPPDGGVP